MQEQKRRHTAYHRHSQRRHDFGALLNRMLSDGSESSLRQSLNPIKQQQILSLTSMEHKLSKDVVHALIKLLEKEVLIIGMILPHKTLQKCWEILGSSKQTFSSKQGIRCAFLNKHSIINTSTLLLMMDEEEVLSERRVGKTENMLLNLSLALVASSRLVEKRLELWEEEEFLFDKHSGLLLLRGDQTPLSEYFLQRIETEFWYLEVLLEQDLQASSMKPKSKKWYCPQEAPIIMQRQAYQVMSEQQEEESLLLSKLSMLGEICLKRNWKISKGIMCYPFLYLLDLWVGEELDPRQLLERALLNYSKYIEEDFNKFLENLKLPLDQLKLRNVVGLEKRNISLGVRKHLTMFQSIFPKFQRAEKALEGLELFFSDKSRDIFEANNALAGKSNLALLQKLYSQTIESKFESSLNRTIEEFQSDFQKLLDTYSSQSLRVSSQLQTFNNYLKERKYEYLQGLGKQLQIGNKKYYSEKQELKDRLQIQIGVLETLELELRDLEDRRRKIDLENSLLKTTITEFTKRKGEPTSENNIQSRRKYLEISESRRVKAEAKDGVGREPGKNRSRCCCQVM